MFFILKYFIVDGMVKKSKRIHPDETLYLQLSALPLSIHKMRMNGLLAVGEITKDEFMFEQKKTTSKTIVKSKKVEPMVVEEVKSTVKKHGKKKDDDEVKVDVMNE